MTHKRSTPLKPLAVLLLATTALAAPSLAFAQQPPAIGGAAQAVRIDRIIVRGNERIESSTIISYMPIQIGQVVTPEQVDAAVKALYDSGLFANITITTQGNDMVVVVEEYPIINRVVFEGEHALAQEKLQDEVNVRPRGVFTPAKVQQDVQRIIELYRRSGRIAATVTPKVVELPQKRVDLIFEINEGEKSGILDVNFLGNRIFSDATLANVIVTERSTWYKFFSNNDNYDPDRIDYDISQLRTFYRNKGYYDFNVRSSVAEYRPDQNGFAVTFTVDEGRQYHFGALKVETELNQLDSEILQRLLPIKPGEIYQDEKIEQATDALVFAAGSAGFAFVDVIPDYHPNPETGTVDVTFRVTEGPRVYVERIDIVGNTQTLDRVVRREMELSEGDAFNRVLVDRSERNIRALQFFSNQKITELPGSAPDRTVLRVEVAEQPTGQLAFSAGYSSLDQLVLDLSVSESNFRGRGQNLVAQVRTGSFQRNINFSFTEPHFLGRNLRAGVDVYSFKYDFSRQANYETNQTGANLRFGFPLSQNSFLGLNYSLRDDKITVPTLTCSVSVQPALCSQIGSRITSLAGLTWTLDRRNDPIRPTRGYSITARQDISGLGGDTRYIRTEGEASWYYGLTPQFIFSANGSAGYVDAYGGQRLRISDRFYKGGSTFRGFETAGIGPRDTSYDSSLGGKAYAIGTLEMTVPTFLPEQYGINASLFTDFGTLGGIDPQDRLQCTTTNPPVCTVNPNVKDSYKIRASAGISIGWRSPLGPIQFDFSKVISKEDYDRTELFRFSTRTGF